MKHSKEFTCEEINYFKSSKSNSELFEWAAENRVPIQGMLEITSNCNFKCVHCYVTNSKETQKDKFLTFDFIKDAIDQVYEMGCRIISLTGGECMLHPNFKEIYTYIHKKGIEVNIFTNASLISEDIISLFKQYPPSCVEVSLYGASEETYKQTTKAVGFEKVISGLEALKNNNINLQLKIIVLKQNQHEIEQMKDLASKYTNNPIRVSSKLMPTYDFSVDVLKNQVDTSSNRTREIQNHTGNNSAFKCKAGRSFFVINSEGNVVMCLFARFSAMSLKEHTFREIWNKYSDIINTTIPKDSECYNCKYISNCNNCPAKTWMFTKKFGLYPIPQCIKNISQGVNQLKTEKAFNLNTFLKVSNINVFRLENGNIAAEEVENVLIPLKEDDDVKLITLTKGEKSVSFFEVNNNRINALFADSYVELPDNSEIVEFYETEKYEGVYCKYISSGKPGIIYIGEVEISEVISHNAGYEDVWFENEVFLAKKEKEKNYQILNQAGKVVFEKEFKPKKVKGFEIFYSKNKLFTKTKETDIPDDIKDVEVILDIAYFERKDDGKGNLEKGDILEISSDPEKAKKEFDAKFDEIINTKIKVITSKGIYFYNKALEYLAGPMNNPVIQTIYEQDFRIYRPSPYQDLYLRLPCREEGYRGLWSSNIKIIVDYYILDYIDEKPVSVSFVSKESLINQISSKNNGFEINSYCIYMYNSGNKRKNLIFFSDEDALYAPNLELICTEPKEYKFKKINNHDNDKYPIKVSLTAKDAKGRNYSCSCSDDQVIVKDEFILKGTGEKAYKVYKSNDSYICFDEDENLIFQVEANQGKIVKFKDNNNNVKEYYLFAKDDIHILLDEDGKKVL